MTTIIGLHRAQEIAPILAQEDCGVASVLLYGPKGCGKSLILHKLAEGWLGRGDGEADRAVDSFRRNANPDFFHIAPMGAGNQITLPQISPTKTKAGENVFPLTEFLRVGPLYSRHKVIWIEDAHRMNISAMNSLLKPLEEPPAFAKIILTTSQVSQIPPTILSRCVVVNCELPTSDEMRQLFPDLSPEILELADGSPGTAARIAANPELFKSLLELADRIILSSRHSGLSLSEDIRKLSDKMEDQEKLGMRVTNSRVLEYLAVAVSKRHPGRPEVIHLLADAHKRILANGNAGLVLDSILSKIVLGNKTGTK